MSNWVMLTVPVDDLKAGTLLKTKRYKGKIDGAKVDLREVPHVRVPESEDIARMLAEISPTAAVNIRLDTGMYTLSGFRYGFLEEHRVPVFNNRKVVEYKMARYIRHPRITAKSLNDCLRRTFRLIAMEKLYRIDNGTPVALAWNRAEERFYEREPEFD